MKFTQRDCRVPLLLAPCKGSQAKRVHIVGEVDLEQVVEMEPDRERDRTRHAGRRLRRSAITASTSRVNSSFPGSRPGPKLHRTFSSPAQFRWRIDCTFGGS